MERLGFPGSNVGLTGVRIIKAMAMSRDLTGAIALAEAQCQKDWRDTPGVAPILRAAIGAMTSSNGSDLIGPKSSDLLSIQRPLEIISNVTGIRRVPFDTVLNSTTSATGANWVGEGKPAALTRATFARLLTLGRLKVAALVVETVELIKSSDPNAETMISHDVIGAGVVAVDSAFIDPANAGIATVKPASVTYGAPAFASSGTTALLIYADLGRLIESLIAAGSDLRFAVWVIHPITAAYFARLLNANGDLAFPTMTVKGGVMLGLPVIVSASVPHGGSPSIASIVLLDGSRIWVADDSTMAFEVSRAAAIQMLDNPTNDAAVPTPTTLVSMFQAEAVAILGTRYMNWKIAAPGFAAVLNGLVD